MKHSEVKPGVSTSPYTSYSDVAEGRRVENDVSVNGFIAMLDDLKEHRNVPGYVHCERKFDPNGMWDPCFFAARPVQRNEYTHDEDAMGAYWKEWKNLKEKKVWRWETLTEWWKVSAEARANGEEVHLGFLFGLMVERDPNYRKEMRDVTSSIESCSEGMT